MWLLFALSAAAPITLVGIAPPLVKLKVGQRGAKLAKGIADGTLVECPTPGCRTPLKPSRIAAHLLKCPVLEEQKILQESGYWSPGINSGRDADENPPPPPPALSAEAAAELEERINTAHVHALSQLLHTPAAACTDSTLGINARKRESHRLQRAAIVDELASLGVLGHGHCILEVGAGNGELSLAIAEAYPSEMATDALILLDNSKKPKGRSSGSRLSADEELKSRCQSFTRVKIGVEDCDLKALRDKFAPGRRLVIVAKHLCGAASDFTLRAVHSSSPLVEAIVLGTCCHHRCDYDAYPAREYLNALNLTSAFGSLCRFSSRGVDAFATTSRADTGRRVKDLLDEGRASFLREAGYDANLVRYVDASITPENVLVVGRHRGVTPLARLTIDAIHTTLYDRKPVEGIVKKTLRNKGLITTSDERAVVASAVFGTSILRKRLRWILRSASIKDEQDAAWLLAAFLLHETPRRVNLQALQALLPHTALGLPTEELDRLANLDTTSIEWPADDVEHLATRYSLPMELARMLYNRLGCMEEAAALGEAFNKPGPVTLRANLAVQSRDALLKSLSSEGIECQEGTLSPWAVHLNAAGGRSEWGGSVWNLNGWRDGAFEVQDQGSQFIVLACEVKQNERVLDLCAGNGGKALALAALVGEGGAVLAHDVVESRLAALRSSAVRARVDGVIQTVCTPPSDHGECHPNLLAAAKEVGDDNGLFDIVLVDAPCSSSGTLRRHPGLRWDGAWSDEEEVAADEEAVADRRSLPALQMQLLETALERVKPGGRLIYATCSLDEEENEAVAREFEERWRRSLVEAWPFEEEGDEGMRTLWPQREATDGFFVARWRVR